MRDSRPPTCEWTRRCFGMDDTPTGPVYVSAWRRGSRVILEPVKTLPATGAALAAGLTEKDSWVRRIEAPLASKDKVLNVLPGMLDVQLPFGIEDCAVVCPGLFRNPLSGGWTAITAVAKRAEVRVRLDRWAAEGREPHVLDQEGLALWTRALQDHPPAMPDEPRVVVYLGDDRATLAMGVGENLFSTRGLRKFEPEQALRMIRLVFEGKAKGLLWIWTGPGAERTDELGLLRQRVEAGDAMRHVTVEAPRQFLAGAYAIRALTPGPLRCDFRVDELGHPEVRRLRSRRDIMQGVIWLAASLVLLAGGLTWKTLVEHRESQARRAVRTMAGQVMTELGKRNTVQAGYEVRTVSNALAESAPVYEPFVLIQAPSRGQALGRLLMAVRETDAVLHRLEWTDAALKLEGRAATEDASVQLARHIENETGWPATVKSDRKNDHDFRFVVDAHAAR
jgi:hypothetical protein